jgi:hydroxymethylpyrimidine/phosphomethylpyrimidine kinase
MANDLQRLTKEEVHGVDVSTSLTIKDPTKSPTVSPTSNEVEGPTISPTWRDRKSESNFSGMCRLLQVLFYASSTYQLLL